MVTDGIEIEDAGNKDRDLENTIKELDSKALVSENKISEAEGEKLPCVVANAKKSDDAGQCLKGLEKNLVDITNKEKEDKMGPPTETNEPMDIEGSTRQVDAITKNIDESNPEKDVDDHAMNKQRDVENEVPEHNVSNGGVVKDVKLAENGVDGGNPVENVEENYCDDFSVEKQVDNENTYQNAATGSDLRSTQVPIDVSPNEAPPSESTELDKVLPGRYQEMEATANLSEGKALNELKDKDEQIPHSTSVADGNTKTIETASKLKFDHLLLPIKNEAATPSSLIRYSPAEAGDHSGETDKTVFSHAALPLMAEDDDGTPEEQAAFMKEIESFYRGRAMDFKPPKFYGQPLNCLKLWRAVIRLGGYDRVTGSKLWRQVGESFHPPKTCTTVSWTFRIFYEKSLLEYEKHKIQSGELQLPVAALNDVCGAETEGNGFQGAGSGRARRDAAARAMQGWHVQRLFGNGEDKSICNTAKREKIVKSIGSLKQKRSNEVEHPVKAARVETSKQLAITVVDVGPPADWVKINVRQMKDSFEVYALVPGLLREEVRVQSDPAGRLVITGEPEQVDNPWGITPFKKVVILPSRIDPLQTSAVVSLHGRLFIRVPFEQSDG